MLNVIEPLAVVVADTLNRLGQRIQVDTKHLDGYHGASLLTLLHPARAAEQGSLSNLLQTEGYYLDLSCPHRL
jgi:hypothetical protein